MQRVLRVMASVYLQETCPSPGLTIKGHREQNSLLFSIFIFSAFFFHCYIFAYSWFAPFPSSETSSSSFLN